MPWTAERTDLLKKLWHDGISAAAIAESLGQVTRNAVIGKVHRLGLAGRQAKPGGTSRPINRLNTAGRRPEVRSCLRPLIPQARAKRPRKPKNPPKLGPPPEAQITVATLTAHTCRWPEGDPKHTDFHFCGRAKAATGPYCPHHAVLSAA
jgi:GcrA cell cycle regulator